MMYKQKNMRDSACSIPAGKLAERMRRKIRTGLLTGAVIILLAGGLTGCFNFVFGTTDDDVSMVPLPPYSHDEEAAIDLPTEDISSSSTDNNNYYFNVVRNNVSSESETFNLTINAGPGPDSLARVYFQFTNGDSSVSEVPKITPATAASSNEAQHHEESEAHAGHDHDHDHDAVPHAAGPYRVHADLEKMRADALKLLKAGRSSASSADASPSLHNISPTSILRNTDGVDDNMDFYLPIGGTTESFTARAVSTDGTWTAVVWIPDTAFTGCRGDECLTELLTTARAQDIANTFLQSGDDNDMFDWTTNLIGDPWGGYSGFDNLIPSATRQIDIVLHDIGNNRYADGAHIVGYYSSFNNFTKSSDCTGRCSNERLVFYMDAAWAQFDPNARRDEGITLDPERYYNTFLSTLGHELQHMINFYQRVVLDSTSGSISGGDPAWLNEQFSVIMEDILGEKLALGRTGVTASIDTRGVDVLATDGGLSPGTFPICGSRSKTFASQNYYGVSRWESKLINYSVNHSFASFLLRNYGGRGGAGAYLSTAYNSLSNGFGAITDGAEIGASGTTDTPTDLISKWGTAIILSNDTGRPEGYRFNHVDNNGVDGFSTTVTVGSNTLTYNLGSINYFNYAESGCGDDGDKVGALRFFNDSASIYNTLLNQQHGHSNITYLAGQNMIGNSTYKITLPAGGRLTVVAHRSLSASTEDGTAFNPVFY